MTSTLLQYSTVQCSTVQYSTAPHLGGAGGVRVLGEAPELGAELGAAHALPLHPSVWRLQRHCCGAAPP